MCYKSQQFFEVICAPTGLLAFDADGTGGTAAINLVTLLEKPVITAAKLVIGGSGW